MKKGFSDRNVTVINFGIMGFFGLIYLINYYQIDAVLIGVIREMLTIPFLLALVGFSILGVIYLIRASKKKIGRSISSVLLIICAFITLRTFFL
ncbi:MAG: hypothetical protein JXR05_10730 [Flavobacteriaceae bacterium]